MSNLENFNNIYANLAESAYNGRPLNFPSKSNSKKEQLYDYSQDTIYKTNNGETSFTKGGTNLPNDGIVYLQPDLVDKTMSIQVPKANGGYETQTYPTGGKEQGMLTDTKVGFNSYFVTDTPSLNKDTKQTYLTIRGSDKVSIDTLNDLGGNNVYFLYNMSKNIKLIR